MATQMDEWVALIAEKVKKRLVQHGLNENHSTQSTHSNSEFNYTKTDLFIDYESLQTPQQLSRVIDHTLLKADASQEELKKLCDEATQHRFYSVCVNSANIAFCRDQLKGCQTVPIAVVGFPLGASKSEAKAFETQQAIEEGAKEIDMVLNIGLLKAKDFIGVLNDIQAVVKAAGGVPVKVILETGLLTHEEKIIGCVLSQVGGATFVKTSTGFSTGGATVEDVKLMRSIVGHSMGVKASGGVRSFKTAMDMIKAGANRLGTSSSVAIVTGQKATGNY